MKESLDDLASDDRSGRCAYSGECRLPSEMLRLGDHWVAPEHKDAFVQFLKEGGDPRALGKATPLPRVGTALLPMIQQCWKLVKANAAHLIPLFIIVSIAVGGINHGLNLLQSHIAIRDHRKLGLLFFSVGFGRVLVVVLVRSVMVAAIQRVTLVTMDGGPTDFMSSCVFAIRKSASLLTARILLFTASYLSFFCFVIPGLIALVRFWFAPCAIVADGTGPLSGLKKSIDLTKGKYWTVMSELLAVRLAMGLPSLLLLGPKTIVSLMAALFPEKHFTIVEGLSSIVPHMNWPSALVLTTILGTPLVFAYVFDIVLYRNLASDVDT